MSERGVMFLDPQLLAEVSKCVIIKMLSIVRDEDPRDSEVANDAFLDKALDVLLCNSG